MIRELKQDDNLIPLLSEWKSECQGDLLAIECDPEVTQQHLKMVKNSQGVVFVLDDSGIVGIIGVQLIQSPIGRNLMGNEHLWYVEKNHRGIGSVRLFSKAMKWAAENGCTHFMATASMLASELHDTVCDLYKIMGMQKFETTYIGRLGG